MSDSVTPRRRSRDDESEEDVLSVNSKRQRLDDDEDMSGSEDDETHERPLFPDTYRRSPKGKGRAGNTIRPGDHQQQEHKPGAIVRVKLKNFVTYTNAEFLPGPNLNMVIGPNGTGKSTLVCAICIGLGWSTVHLGRAKDITEFVKHGEKEAEIEIELKADSQRHEDNPVITHKICKDGGSGKTNPKSTWLINDKKSTAKAVQDLARCFSIQVDNLCQFLPQDRVVEFAALSPVDLLLQTQKAAAPDYMTNWHEELKELHKDEKRKTKDQQETINHLKNLEDRQKSQEVEVERLRERDAKKEEKRVLEMMRPFAEYEGLRVKHAEVKKHWKKSKEELKVLERKMQPNVDAIAAKTQYCGDIDRLISTKWRLLTKLEGDVDDKLKKYQETAASIEEAENKIKAERSGGKDSKAKIQEYQKELRRIDAALHNPPPAFDAEEFNRQITQEKNAIRRIENDIERVTQGMDSLKVQGKQRKDIIAAEEERKTFLESQDGQQASKLEMRSKDAARAWSWIQRNRDQFSGEIFGPPIIECSVKNMRYASQIESVLKAGELMAFTVSCREDYRKLDDQLKRVLKLSNVNVREAIDQPVSSWRRLCSEQQLRQMGFEGWLLDLLDGPDVVLSMLCDNARLNEVPYTNSDISEEQRNRIPKSISTYVTTRKLFRVMKRQEYGPQGISTTVTDLQPARHFDDAPVSTQEEQDINRKIVEAKGELAHIQEDMKAEHAKYVELRAQLKERITRRKEIEDDKKKRQTQQTEFGGLQTRRENVQGRLQDAQDAVTGLNDRVLKIVDSQDDLCLKKGQEALDHARSLESLRRFHEQVLEYEIMGIEAKSDVAQLEAKNSEERQLRDEKKLEVTNAQQQKEEAEQLGLTVQRRCKALADRFTEEEGEVHQRISAEGWNLEKLENDIARLQASLDMLHGGNENMIDEYEKRARKIEEKKAQLHSLEASISEVSNKIAEIREQWEPRLDELVSNISEAFAENFARIQCAGGVAVHKDDDFGQWSIQIKVKFRENEQLSVLDSHRQSGGERAVSTIFYLMALQSLARAPFRVVDEINQGMDPRNERLVHSRMVEIACAEHTSQYFLITPKLLPNLVYHPNMKVHCIASGEYMPSDHKELDFEALAQKALAIRAG